ncbi:non-homologous end-joining DNA ligase LigD [Paraburkholderia sp. RL17-337-BIB-A]|uniref:non-homologous end-joining DNA ligase LigD n=1 Tax=Paraburkholderia sp. RL17-337-BIB-A TaxID=3031636 RepID=UPI0038BDD4D7
MVDPSSGVTKLDLVRYYESVVEWMLPHLKDHPLARVRAPTGIAGELFYRMHAEKTGMPWLKAHDRSLWLNHPPLVTVDTVDALMSAAQMNVVGF